MNSTEIKLLELMNESSGSIKLIAAALDKSNSYISECVKHLKDMGFVSTRTSGNSLVVSLETSPLGNSLRKILNEMPYLNLQEFLGGSAIKVLQQLQDPGSSMKHLINRTGLSKRTIQALISKWRQMGLVRYKKRVYTLNPIHRDIKDFITQFNEYWAMSQMVRFAQDGTLIWFQRDEFLFSVKRYITKESLHPSATTRLDELDYEIVYLNNYYLYSKEMVQVSEEEALVQAMLVDPLNPRVPRFIMNKLRKKSINPIRLAEFGSKYGINVEAVI